MFNHQTTHQTTTILVFFVSLFIGTKATAQVTESISIDPYNDSSVQTIPLDTNTPPASKITETVYIDANPTPRRSSQVKGSLTSSSQSLPAIPPLAQPYSKQSNSNKDNDNTSTDPTNTSISVSPFNTTPTEDNEVVKTNHQSKSTTQAKTTNVTPSSVSSNNQNTQPSLPQQQGNRRSLKDILIQSSPSISNNNSTTVTNRQTNNNTSVILSASVTNQQARKVLVKVNNEEEKLLIKSHYPQAFNKRINGDSFLQIGIFSSNENIQQVSQSLTQIGFEAIVMP